MATEAEGRIRDLIHAGILATPAIAESSVVRRKGGQRIILHFKNFDDIEIRVRQLKPKARPVSVVEAGRIADEVWSSKEIQDVWNGPPASALIEAAEQQREREGDI